MTHSVDNVDPEDNVDLDDTEFSAKQRVLHQMGMEVKQISGPPWLAIADKVTPDHITTILGHVGKSQEIDFKKNEWARWERVIYAFLVTGILICLTIFIFPRNQETYLQILEWAGLFFAGGFGGYGIGVRRRSRARSYD